MNREDLTDEEKDGRKRQDDDKLIVMGSSYDYYFVKCYSKEYGVIKNENSEKAII